MRGGGVAVLGPGEVEAAGRVERQPGGLPDIRVRVRAGGADACVCARGRARAGGTHGDEGGRSCVARAKGARDRCGGTVCKVQFNFGSYPGRSSNAPTE